MLTVLVILSLILMATGFLVTPNNARYLLSGYNTLSEQERQQVDIHRYLALFKKFHLVLGLSLLLLGLLLYYWVSPDASGIFMGLYPIAAYLWLVWRSRQFTGGAFGQSQRAGMWLLVATLVLVGGLLLLGYRTDTLLVSNNALEISGLYSETLPVSTIKSVELVTDLPKIDFKRNGFALGAIKKGRFVTEAGEEVKLVLNVSQPPFLLITTTDGRKIYYSAGLAANEQIVADIQKMIPGLYQK